jgi:hypothetical protein
LIAQPLEINKKEEKKRKKKKRKEKKAPFWLPR